MPRITQHLKRGRWVSEPSLGFVLLARTQLDAGTVSHEAVHMATSYMRRVGQTLSLHKHIDDREEVMAYHIGDMTDQLNHHLHESGCYL